jgi:hypothetical protein
MLRHFRAFLGAKRMEWKWTVEQEVIPRSAEPAPLYRACSAISGRFPVTGKRPKTFASCYAPPRIRSAEMLGPLRISALTQPSPLGG